MEGPNMRWLVAFIVGYIGSKAVFALVGFHYSPFTERFHIGKLVVDIGVFAFFFGGAYWLFGRLRRSEEK